jgi:hypothetical protein
MSSSSNGCCESDVGWVERSITQQNQDYWVQVRGLTLKLSATIIMFGSHPDWDFPVLQLELQPLHSNLILVLFVRELIP